MFSKGIAYFGRLIVLFGISYLKVNIGNILIFLFPQLLYKNNQQQKHQDSELNTRLMGVNQQKQRFDIQSKNQRKLFNMIIYFGFIKIQIPKVFFKSNQLMYQQLIVFIQISIHKLVTCLKFLVIEQVFFAKGMIIFIMELIQ
ncbi:unnamed protein product [Paramecium pentaurelia]|uniref:Transmembrane protein n=1 Tax=Paramecium pentaurelia TaxID=43138 RepID=A0A8S1YBZ9_9CILI|nr:unnamed protein product [Paramecium pentaurelia]